MSSSTAATEDLGERAARHIIHNSGRINKLYVEKVWDHARGEDGEELAIDRAYFRQAIVTLKTLSGQIQSKTEEKYK